MKDQTNEESLDPVPGELPDTAGRPGAASAQHGGKHGAFPADVGVIRHRLHYGDQPKPKGTGKLVT
jgi:hypothetical protein